MLVLVDPWSYVMILVLFCSLILMITHRALLEMDAFYHSISILMSTVKAAITLTYVHLCITTGYQYKNGPVKVAV